MKYTVDVRSTYFHGRKILDCTIDHLLERKIAHDSKGFF